MIEFISTITDNKCSVFVSTDTSGIETETVWHEVTSTITVWDFGTATVTQTDAESSTQVSGPRPTAVVDDNESSSVRCTTFYKGPRPTTTSPSGTVPVTTDVVKESASATDDASDESDGPQPSDAGKTTTNTEDSAQEIPSGGDQSTMTMIPPSDGTAASGTQTVPTGSVVTSAISSIDTELPGDQPPTITTAPTQSPVDDASPTAQTSTQEGGSNESASHISSQDAGDSPPGTGTAETQDSASEATDDVASTTTASGDDEETGGQLPSDDPAASTATPSADEDATSALTGPASDV